MDRMPETLRKIWTQTDTDARAEAELVRELCVHPLTARLLVNRGLSDPAKADAFLRPDLSQLHDPFGLPDMDKAAHRIAEAIANEETIFIHGDYDVDGVTSTALYVRTLTALGGKIVYRVPHRKLDGYDLKNRAIDHAKEQGATLVITSDCGIQAREAVAYANSLGMTVIVTDHHEPGETLPPAYAVVNPHRHDSTYPFPYLAGVGVAFKTMQAVVRLVRPEHETAYIQKFLDLVACGTVADVMPLQGENRVFASFGLKALARTRKVGLRALLEGARIDTSKPLSAEAVGFGIGPRINAVGRLDDAAIALDLMLTGDPEEALRLVETLNNFNAERQIAQKRILAEAIAQVADRDMDLTHVLVVASPGWNAGVVGIVAGKLVEMFQRPAIVIGIDETETNGKGSARSIPGFDMFKGIQICRGLLESCGGHEMAAGLSLKMSQFDAFVEMINAHAASVLTADDFIPRVSHDGVIDPGKITLSLLDEWEQFAPFGDKNPEPRFASTAVRVCESRRIGKDLSHLKMRVRTDEMDPMDCVGWGHGGWSDEVGPGEALDLLYSPQVNEWNGRRSVQLLIKDIRRTEE
ncbi:MAG: single-stranded-DNA-specific exonuclease RecJ [Capsulimonas sp.]|nr:single-stranded-DNA-specific exonuclease RecJ [Capsulimonas sp.]